MLPSGRFPVSGLSTREKDLLQITGLDADRAAELGQEALATAALGKLSGTSSRGSGRQSHRPAALSLSQVVTIDNRPWFSAVPAQETETGDVAALAGDVAAVTACPSSTDAAARTRPRRGSSTPTGY